MNEDNQKCQYIYQRSNKSNNNCTRNISPSSDSLCAIHQAQLKYNISKSIGLSNRENKKNFSLLEKKKIEVIDTDDDSKKSKENFDEEILLPIIDDNSNDDNSNDIDDLDINEIISKLTDYFDQRYQLKNGEKTEKPDKKSGGMNFEMIAGIFLTSIIPIILKKFDTNSISNKLSNAANNIIGTEESNQQPRDEPKTSGDETKRNNETPETPQTNEDNTNATRALTECIG